MASQLLWCGEWIFIFPKCLRPFPNCYKILFTSMTVNIITNVPLLMPFECLEWEVCESQTKMISVQGISQVSGSSQSLTCKISQLKESFLLHWGLRGHIYSRSKLLEIHTLTICMKIFPSSTLIEVRPTERSTKW